MQTFGTAILTALVVVVVDDDAAVAAAAALALRSVVLFFSSHLLFSRFDVSSMFVLMVKRKHENRFRVLIQDFVGFPLRPSCQIYFFDGKAFQWLWDPTKSIV